MKKGDIELARAVLALEGHGGPAWETFMKHLRQYRDQCMKDFLASPNDMLQVSQGRARGAQEIVSCIEAARDTAARN